jgi:hypothetical protein
MTNPTSNYGFVLPTSSDLVTDLPADFDVALQGVDTRLKALQPGTTLGDLAYSSATANTNTRLGIGTAGQVLAVVGGVPAWSTTADQTPLTTKGDLFTFTTVDARLGVGANDTVLIADSAQATGLKWGTPASGGMAVISSGSLSSTALTISSISGSYIDLQLVIRNFKTGTDGATLKMRFNGDTNTRYRRFLAYGNSGALAFDATDIQFVAGNSNVNANGLSVIEIPDYTNTSTWQTCNWVSANDQDSTGGGVQNNIGYAVYNQLDAITSITLTPSAGTMTGTYTLYGVK